MSCSRTSSSSILASVVILAFLCQRAATAAPTQWLTEPKFRVQLKKPSEYAWSQKPLRDALASLGEHHQIAILLDRRIDPDQLIPGSSRDVPLEILLLGIADHLKVGVSFVGPVVYFGPQATTAKLATLSELRKDELKKYPSATRRRLASARQWQWPLLSEPRRLVDQIAADAKLEIRGTEQIPHDLWQAQSLPPLGCIERLSLVLAGFDLTFQFTDEGRAIEIVPIPESVAVQRIYTLPRGALVTDGSLRRKFPNAAFRLEGQRVTATASAEDHRLLADYFAGREIHRPNVGAPAAPRAEVRIKELSVKNKTVEAVINYLAAQLKFKVDFDDEAAKKKSELISFKVEDATIDEVLKTALEQVMLTFRRNGETVVVIPNP